MYVCVCAKSGRAGSPGQAEWLLRAGVPAQAAYGMGKEFLGTPAGGGWGARLTRQGGCCTESALSSGPTLPPLPAQPRQARVRKPCRRPLISPKP